jgi:fatty acid desaturase
MPETATEPTARPTVHDIPISMKSSLVDADGLGYREFKAGLRPRWWSVWAQIAAAHLVIAGTVVGLVALDPGFPLWIAAAIGGGAVIGYAITFLNNFFHEAAHHNIAPNRRANDLLANVTMGWLYASSIALYRKVHFQHHRALGTTMDSENSYFDPLRVRYLVEGLTGLKLLRTLRRWHEVEESRESDRSDEARGARLLWTAIAALVNGAIVIGLALAGAWAAAGAWVGGELIVFPFLASLRQTLEHRDEHADPEVDYRQVDHGATNRLFGDGPVASTLGSAGFNRHALHHWEPQVSCTRMRDLESYLLRTELEPMIRERQTTYRDTFLRLLGG